MSTPPTREQGQPGGIQQTFNPYRRGTTYEVDPLEDNKELAFPESIPVYDRMRSQDGHVGSVLSAIVLSLTSANWDLRTEGVRPEVVDQVRNNLGLPAPGNPRVRNKGYGISWKQHVAEAVEPMLWAGFMAFEQVYAVTDDGAVQLRKLAPRLPRTITKIETGRDGGLQAVYQAPVFEVAKPWEDVKITVDRLVMYAHRKEGADWSGRSILRQAYKHWMIKDVLLRLDAQAAERGSMGIPVVYYDDESMKEQALAASSNARAGATAGIALPRGCSMEILGISGSTVDLIPRIRYHDQEIARSALAMFLDITSNENGSRALAEPVINIFMDSVQALADQVAETATEHVIRDLVRLNFGDDEPYPEITPGDMKAARGIAVEQLKALVDANIIQSDDKLEEQQRAIYGLPEKDADTVRIPSDTSRNAETAGALVRAGFDPAASAEKAGLGAIPHIGLPPVTVQNDREVPQGVAVQAAQPALDGLDTMLSEMREAREARTRWYSSRQQGDQ